MTIGSISFQSNISIILITIIMILICVYFYLDSRKMKLQIETLEKNNEMFIKDIEQINTGLHQIFSMNKKLLGSVEEKGDNIPTKISDTSPGKIIEGNDVVSEVTNDMEDIVSDKQEINPSDDLFFNINSTKIDDKKDNIIDENNDIIDDILEENDNDDLEDEIDDEIDDDSGDDSDDDLDDSGDGGKIVDLEDDIKLDETINMEGIDDLITGDIVLGGNHSDDIVLGGNHSDELQKYLDMSVKDLKEKCVELDLKHSGNKHTLAQRIVDKLG